MNTFLTSNETKYKLLRTIVEAIIGVVIANLDFIVGTFNIPVEYKTFIVALVIAILTPILSEVGKKGSNEKH